MYTPHDTTIDFFVWREMYLPQHDNITPLTHFKMIDYYLGIDPDGIGMIQCHRGLGKSQLAMEYSLFCICEGIEQYVLFVGGTQDLTNDLVGSASELAQDIPYIKVNRSVEGVLEITNKYGQEAFLVAKSTGSKLRGVAKGKLRQRPTAVVLDDVVSDDLVLNRLRMARANRWMTSALFPTLVPGGKVFGSGTPMNDGDPFMTLCNTFGSFKIPLDEYSFPDRFTPEYIARKKAQYEKLGQMRDWKREFELLLTDDDTAIFDMKKVAYCTEEEVPKELVWYITLDGAFSEKDAADYSAFACLGLDTYTGKWYVAPYDMKGRPQEVIDKLFELNARYGGYEVGIEKGAFKLSMEAEIEQKQLDYQQYFTVNELSVAGSKISRIKALAPVVNSGRLTIIDTGESAERLVDQMTMTDSFAVNTSHDDLVDAMSQLLQMDLQIVVQEEDSYITEDTYVEPSYGYMYDR